MEQKVSNTWVHPCAHMCLKTQLCIKEQYAAKLDWYTILENYQYLLYKVNYRKIKMLGSLVASFQDNPQ